MYVTFDGMNVIKNEQVVFSSHSDTSTIVVDYLRLDKCEVTVIDASGNII